MDSGEVMLSKLFCFPYENESALKGKNLRANSFLLEYTLQMGFECKQEVQTGVSVNHITENPPFVPSPLKRSL